MTQSHGYGGPPPDPIPPGYYARTPGRAPAWTVLLDGLRRLSTARRVALALGSLLGIILAVQLPWHPALGLFGLLVIVTTVLATNAWDLRLRVPLLRSPGSRGALAVWGVLGVLLLLSGLAARPASTPSTTAGERAAGATTPASAAATPAAAPPTVPVVIDPTATPSPTPTPTPTPRPTATPTGITIILLPPPFTATRGQSVNFSVRTTARTACSIAIGYSGAPALPPATPDQNGNVGWSWLVSRRAPLGAWPITVTCGGGTGSTTITITSIGG